VEELISAVEEARRQGNADLEVHGWTVKTRRRGTLPRCDIELRGPDGGPTLYSIVSLKRHLGLEGGSTSSSKRPKRSGSEHAAGADDEDDEEDGEAEEADAPEPIWVACDACGKWRRLPSVMAQASTPRPLDTRATPAPPPCPHRPRCAATTRVAPLTRRPMHHAARPQDYGSLPPMWYCHLHPSPSQASCDAPEER